MFGEIVGDENARTVVGAENFLPNAVGAENFLPLQPQRMILNDAGKIADECWLQIPLHFPNAVLHDHVVMPNHVHGIIELAVSVGMPLRNQFQKMIPRSIGSIVKGFKIGVTKWFRSNTEIYTVWQRNYHEHIIRNEESYLRISNYIINNPANWKEDKFFK